MIRALIVVCACVALGSCTQRMICPAYQSAFIYDKDELRKKFSYFRQDSTPKILTASKNRYLVAEPVSYRTRLRQLQTVAAKPVPVVVPDSLAGDVETATNTAIEADLDRAARSVIDSAYVPEVPRDSAIAAAPADSVYVITRDREVRVLKYNMPDSLEYDEGLGKYVPQAPEYYVTEVGYNMEQDSYMWYVRNDIVLPDVRLAQQQQNGNDRRSARREKRERSKGFFRNLFRKKKADPDSTAVPKPPREEFDFIDPDTIAQTPEGPLLEEEEKRGMIGRKRRNRKVETQPVKPQSQTPAKKEDEDDGF